MIVPMFLIILFTMKHLHSYDNSESRTKYSIISRYKVPPGKLSVTRVAFNLHYIAHGERIKWFWVP